MRKSRNRDNQQSTYLITKYGLQSVQTLIDYLEQQFVNTSINETIDLPKAHKIKQQIQYLQNEREKHFQRQKDFIIDHLMQCVEDEKDRILQQFEANKRANLQDIIAQIKGIEEQLQMQHMKEFKQAEQLIDIELCDFIDKKPHKVLELTKQLQRFCQLEQYQQAQKIRKILERTIMQNNKIQYYKWKNHRESKLKNLESKQQKQRSSLRHRLQTLINEQIKARNQQYLQLVRRLDIQKKRVHTNLLKQQSKYKEELNQLSTSRFMKASRSKDNSISRIRFSRNVSSQIVQDIQNEVDRDLSTEIGLNKKAQIETGACTQIHTSRRSLTPQ